MAIDLNDKTSNGNNLTNNGATEVTGHLGATAVKVVGASSQYLNAPNDAAAWKQTGSFTVECWLNFAAAPGAGNYPDLIRCANSSLQGWTVFYNGDAGKIQFYTDTGAGSSNVAPNTVFPTGADHHFAVAYNQSNAQFTLDGADDGAPAITRNPTYSGTTNCVIGGVTGRFITADLIDDVRIWSVARTITEINNNKAIELTGSETNLVAYYPFNALAAAGGGAGETGYSYIF